MRSLVEAAGLSRNIEVRSAGTHAYHAGEGADPRSARAARRRGYDLSSHRARPVTARDFEEFDWILSMDRENHSHLERLARESSAARRRAKLATMLSFAPTARYAEVPDPYSRGDEGFEIVLDLLESACEGLLEEIRRSPRFEVGRTDAS